MNRWSYSLLFSVIFFLLLFVLTITFTFIFHICKFLMFFSPLGFTLCVLGFILLCATFVREYLFDDDD